MKHVTTLEEFDAWLADAPVGEACIYAELVYPEHKSAAQQALFDRVREAWQRGLVFTASRPTESTYLWPVKGQLTEAADQPRTWAWTATKTSPAAMAVVHQYSRRLEMEGAAI